MADWIKIITRKTKNPPVVQSHRSLATGAAFLCALLSVQPALGQDAGTITVDVAHCLELESSAARFDCFGAQVDSALDESGTAETQGATPVATGTSSAVIEDTNADEPLRLEDASQTAAERSTQNSAERSRIDQPAAEAESETASEIDEEEFFGTIVAIRERLPSSYIITLDNGQVWQQTEPKQYFLRPGLDVRIYPTRWGQRYRLSSVGSGGHIQVQRLR